MIYNKIIINMKEFTRSFKRELIVFHNFFVELGSTLFYLVIGMCSVQYKAYGIMGICLIGLYCSLFNTFLQGKK